MEPAHQPMEIQGGVEKGRGTPLEDQWRISWGGALASEPITRCPEEKFPDGEDGSPSDGLGTGEGHEERIHRLLG